MRINNHFASRFEFKRILTPPIKTHRSIVAERINSLLNHTSNAWYLEIGVYKGFTFELIKANHRIGIDPKPKCRLLFSSETFSLEQKESDTFFVENRNNNLLLFDVVYIDGLHDFWQCYKDVINALNMLSENGFILIDDVKPTNNMAATKISDVDAKFAASIDTQQSEWQGDVFLVLEALIRFHFLDIEMWTLSSEDRYQTVLKKRINVRKIQGIELPKLEVLKDISFDSYFYNGIPANWNVVGDKYFFEEILS